MAEFTLEQTGGTGVLHLKGALTIQQAGDLKDALLRVLSGAEQVSLRLEQVTEVDISGLQLLCSAFRTALTRKKKLLISGPVPESITKTAADSGFSCRSGCAADSKIRCPWI